MLNENNQSLLQPSSNRIIDGADLLFTLNYKSDPTLIPSIVETLKRDEVALIKNVSQDKADDLMFSVSEQLGLSESLEIQSGFASIMGHRKNIGRYFMSVNERSEYQFIYPHSEGSSYSNFQIASFYCFENSTDGGETILMKINQETDIWDLLREKVNRGRAERPLTQAETNQFRLQARINMPEDTLSSDDEVLSKRVLIPGFTLFEVLAKPKKTYSYLLNKKLYAYWDSIASLDKRAALEFYQLLTQHGLLKSPYDNCHLDFFDYAATSRLRDFGTNFNELFSCQIIYKMQPGDLILQDNLSWVHSANNWSPDSGSRKIAAAFA
jgi:hypothetical protein